MHVATRSMKFVAGDTGLLPFRFCMPSPGLANPASRGLWFNDAFGRRMVPVAITDRAVEPDCAFRAILPHQEVEVEITSSFGKNGDWVVCAPNGAAAPITDGVTNGAVVAGLLLEDAEPGDIARILFWPIELADLGEEQVLVP